MRNENRHIQKPNQVAATLHLLFTAVCLPFLSSVVNTHFKCYIGNVTLGLS